MITAKSSDDFTDLKDLDAATKAKIDALISAGVFNGVSDTEFGLKEEMNRAQFAKVAALITGLPVNPDLKTSSFTDVKADDSGVGYALPFISALEEAGIMEGVGGGKFDPAGKVTKEQLATILVRSLGKEDEVETTPSNNPTVSDWAQGYVDTALKLGLISKAADDTFDGKTSADREDLAAGAFETAKKIEEIQPPYVSGTHFEAGDVLHLTLTAKVDLKSIDLSKLKIGGVPFNSELYSFELSEDMKTIIIKLRNTLPFDPDNMPLVDISDLKLTTLYGTSVKNDDPNLKPTPTPIPTPSPSSNPNPKPSVSPSPSSNPNPKPSVSPSPNPSVSPNPNDGPNPSVSPNPNDGPNPSVSPNPNDGPNPSVSPNPNESLNPNQSQNPN